METISLTPGEVRMRLAPDAVDARILELEHLLQLERARRQAIEDGLDRLSARCSELARENAALREQLGGAAVLPSPA